MTQFKGIKQVTKRFYESDLNVEKSGYLFLVRDGEYDGEGADARLIEDAVSSYSVYFGTRKYSDDGQFFYKNLNTASGGLFDVNGQFIFPAGVEWTSITTDGIDSLADLLKALDTVIKTNADKFASYYDKDSVKGLLKAFAKSVDVKVNDTTTISGSVDDEGKISINLSSAFDAAGKVKDVKVGGTTVVSEDGVANITIPEVPFQSVVTDDKVLTLNGGVLSSTLSYTREDVNGVDSLVLKGIDNAVIGSVPVADFVADGMLESVEELENGKFRFTFNIDKDGVEGKDYFEVDFSRFIDTYHADGTSIEMKSGNTFSVKEVDATKTKLGTDIQIAGGPLANNVVDSVDVWPTGWTDASGNKIIPAGQSMEQILTALFLKVVEGTVTWDAKANWSPSLSEPVPVLTSGPVEVGATVKVTKLTAGKATAGTRTASCSCTQGYFLADENGEPTGSHNAGNKSLSATGSIEGTASYAWTWNGSAVDVTVNSTELTCSNEGANKIKVTQSGQTAVVDTLPTTKVFAATNTKTVLSDKSATFTDDTSKTPTSVALSKTSDEVSVNAYYRIYTNGKQGSNGVASSETALVADDATKLNLVADGTAFYVNFAPMIDGGTGYRLLVKSGKTITQAMALNTLNSKYEVDMKSSFVKADASVKKICGGVEIDYDVYEAKGSAGANAIQFKID